MSAQRPSDPALRMQLRSAIEYLRDEAARLGLPRVARALQRAIDILERAP